MPLHDWTDRDNWDGFHTYWITEIARRLRATLPPPFRAIIGTSPLVAIGGEVRHPDVAVANGTSESAAPTATTARAPDAEVAVATLEVDTTLQIERNGRLVSVVELISPRNKDRPSSRDQYAGRYLGYLRGGVHLLIVDVHRRPLGFSFPQLIAATLGERLPAPPAPSAVVYGVGGAAATGGRMLSVWAEPLTVGEPLPTMTLPLTPDHDVPVDLAGSYNQAAADSYLS